MKYIKKPVRSLLHVLGFDLVPYTHPSKSLTSLKPNCRHESGFVYDIFGHLLYQNVTDHVNYGPLRGQSLQDYAKTNSDELAFIADTIKPGQNVLDLGANIGFYTLMLAKLVGPTGSVTAFEPGPLSFSLLNLNVVFNGYKNVTLVNKGVTAESHLEFYYSNQTIESGSTVTTLEPDFGHTRERIPIETVSLDDYFSDHSSKIDYIKIDIEGGEYNALKGMTKLINSNPDLFLTIEYAPYLPLWKDVHLEEFLRFIRSFGFQIFDLHVSNSESVSDEYLLRTYPKEQVGKYSNLVLKRK